MLAILFGLSMDYEVFLLSRIREQWDRTGDNDLAVATGVQKTGRIITSAALLLAVVIGAFSFSGIVFMKMIGVGMLVALLIDATVVRALLVPATMKLLGRLELVGARPDAPLVGALRLPRGRLSRGRAGAGRRCGPGAAADRTPLTRRPARRPGWRTRRRTPPRWWGRRPAGPRPSRSEKLPTTTTASAPRPRRTTSQRASSSTSVDGGREVGVGERGQLAAQPAERRGRPPAASGPAATPRSDQSRTERAKVCRVLRVGDGRGVPGHPLELAEPGPPRPPGRGPPRGGR